MIAYNRPKIIGPALTAFDIMPQCGHMTDGKFNNSKPLPPNREEDRAKTLGLFLHTSLKSYPGNRPLNLKPIYGTRRSTGDVVDIHSGLAAHHYTANSQTKDISFLPLSTPPNTKSLVHPDLNFAGVNSTVSSK